MAKGSVLALLQVDVAVGVARRERRDWPCSIIMACFFIGLVVDLAVVVARRERRDGPFLRFMALFSIGLVVDVAN